MKQALNNNVMLLLGAIFALVAGTPGHSGLTPDWGPGIGCHWHFRRSDGECPAGGGDPHFRMISGEHFSYHGQCDLVYMSCPRFYSDVGMEIHIRTKIKEQYSLIQGIALKFGETRFEMDASDTFFVDGKTYEKTPPEEFAGYPIIKIDEDNWCGDRCAKARIWLIRFNNVTWVQVANMFGYIHIRTSGDFDSCTGMMGRAEVGKFARNGTVLEDTNEFGNEWRVQTSDPALFQYPRYDQCILPQKTFRRRVSAEVSRMAFTECQHLSGTNRDMCIFDVEQTGNPLMAYSILYSRA